MKNYKQILEAVNKGIKLALDDYQDIEPNSSISQTNDVINAEDVIKQRIELNNYIVDLGLPSGTLWSKRYMGIYYIESPSGELLKREDPTSDDNCINYYAWGETKPNKDKYDDAKFGWANYKFGHRPNKYTSQDNLIQLEDEDDIAYQKFHIRNIKFHIPTKKQFEELLQYTTYEYIDEYTSSNWSHIWGGKFTSAINNNSIFFPYAAIKSFQDSFMGGRLWSSTAYNDNQSWCLFFNSNFCRLEPCQKCDGLPICPVCKI